MTRRRHAAMAVPMKRPTRDLPSALAAAGPLPALSRYADDETTERIAAQRIAWHDRRQQITDNHRRRSRLSDPAMVQERHSPTVEIAVDDPEAKKRARRNLTRVRQSEAWRHNQLTPMQRQAETEIMLTWKTLSAGLSTTSSAAFRGLRFGASAVSSILIIAVTLEEVWRDFVPELRRRRIRRDVVIEMLSEPRTMREVEHDHRLPHGRALAIYTRALDCWCELRGWMRPPATIHGALISA